MAQGLIESQSQSQEQSGQQPGGALSRSRLVQRLLSAGASLPAFLTDLLTTQAVVVAGSEAAAFLIERGEDDINLRNVAHLRPDQSDAQTRAAAVTAFQNILKPCVIQGKDGAVEIGAPDSSGEAQFCLVTLLRGEREAVAVTAVITRCRDTERARQRLMSMQLVAGYFELYSLKRTSEQSRLVAQSHQHVLQLATSVATAEGFDSAAMNLCNELAARTGATRVSIGWRKARKIRLKALSHTEKFDKKQELVTNLQKVMEECVDQEEIVHFDPAGGGSPNVTRSAAEFSRKEGGAIVLSLPLRRKNEIVGVATLEFEPGTKLSENAAAGLAVAMDLLAPQLYDRFENDRWLIVKAGQSVKKTALSVKGGKHTLAIALVLLIIAVGVFISVYKPMYRVSAPFQFAPVEKRSVSVPFNGVLEKLAIKDGKEIEPGVRVKAGETLAVMDTYELKQKQVEALTRANSYALEAAKARGERDIAKEKIAQAQRDGAIAEAELYAYQIAQATIKAPIDGEILKGDLRDKKGSRIEQGMVLFEIAPREQLKAELIVNERDIQSLKNSQELSGELATTGLPTRTFKFKVDRVVPLGEAKEGANVFRVFATLDERDPDWMPGMAGEARINIEPRPLVWIWTHRLIDFVRLKFWI